MEGEHYICLACADRPVFDGKVAAYGHAFRAHRALLEDVHVDELFEIRREREPNHAHESQAGPFHCRHCEENGSANRFIQWDTIESHLKHAHNIYRPVYRVDYITETGKIREQTEKERENNRLADEFAARLGMVVGVTDFLTECRA